MNFEPSGFFVLRTPLLPFDDFLRWSDELQVAAALNSNPAELEEAIAADRLRLRKRLTQVYSQPEVREALFVASPHLEESFQIWEREPESERGHGIELALVRYFARMAGRATPFGLCAGCSTGTLGAHTRLELAERNSYRRRTRLGMDYLYDLCQALCRDPAVRRSLTYRPNSSLYRVAGRMRYVESRLEGEKRSNQLVGVEETDALRETLARASAGDGFEELAAGLVDEDISLAEAEEYIEQLIDSQILIPELAPGMTGAEPTEALVEQLTETPSAEHPANVLRKAHSQLVAIDKAGLGNTAEHYRSTGAMLETLPAKVELPHLFPVTMFKPTRTTTLGKAVLDEIVHGIKVLHRLAHPARTNSPAGDELKRFYDAFVSRYERREIPLVEALDAEAGIGFPISSDPGAEGAPLLRELEFPAVEEEMVPWGTRETFLLEKVCEAARIGAEEIHLGSEELEKISTKAPLSLPDAFSVVATVAAASDDALASGNFQLFLQGSTGPSGARFLGRFCHDDAELCRAVERHLRAEEALQPGAIFADVTYLPEPRTGNILARPILRSYEIPYLARSNVPADQQIPVTDLLVAARGERIVLRSRRLGREVIPRLTSAHNFRWQTLGLYHFLCLLQGQGVAEYLGWNWGPLNTAPFLPRVIVGRLVLSKARWHLQKNEIKHLTELRGAARFCAVNAWRKERRMPRLITVAEGDNTLPIDLENVLSVETFASLIKDRDEAILVEMFPEPDRLCARGPEGRFVHELIVPFVRKAEDRSKSEESKTGSPFTFENPAAPSPALRHLSPLSIPRTFPPGSEWLYAKLYTGTASVDLVLQEMISPLVTKLVASGAVDQWFFIRYGDPEWHLRLRFHGDAERLHSDVLPALQTAAAPLLDDSRIWRLQLDTYEREIERYGGAEGIVLAERIFHADSEAVLEMIRALEPGDAGLLERWQLVLRGIDSFLNDFGFALPTKLTLLRKVRTSFAKEFHAGAKLKSQIGERFRKERGGLQALLETSHDADSPLSPGFEILQRRSERLAPIVTDLKACAAGNRLSMPLEELAPSFVHIYANRFLRSAHRAHELVLYDFLARLYDSQLARHHTL